MTAPDEEEIYPLTDEQIAEIKQSQKDVKNGKYLTEEEASKEIEEWFEKS